MFRTTPSASLALTLAVLLSFAGCDDEIGGNEYGIVVGVTTGGSLISAIQVEVELVEGSGGFVLQPGGGAACSYPDGAIGAANSLPNPGGFAIGIIHLEGVPTPGEVATCEFRSRDLVELQDFEVRVIEASDTFNQAISPLPTAAVIEVLER